jgi:hypothetical protein
VGAAIPDLLLSCTCMYLCAQWTNIHLRIPGSRSSGRKRGRGPWLCFVPALFLADHAQMGVGFGDAEAAKPSRDLSDAVVTAASAAGLIFRRSASGVVMEAGMCGGFLRASTVRITSPLAIPASAHQRRRHRPPLTMIEDSTAL